MTTIATKLIIDSVVKKFNDIGKSLYVIHSGDNNRGLLYSKKGDFDRGIEDFNRALELNPKNADFYYLLRGWAYLGKHKFDRTIIKL